MKIIRIVLSVIFITLVVLVLLAMLVQGFQWLPLLLMFGWFCIAMALNALGGRAIRMLAYTASTANAMLSAFTMSMVQTLEPGSVDALGGFMVSSSGILLSVLAVWVLYRSASDAAKSSDKG